MSGASVRVFPRRCKRWACRDCNPRMVRHASAFIAAGLTIGSTSFVTLTMPGDIDVDESFAAISSAFKRLRQRMQRALGPIDWVAVVEAQPGRGAAHLHVLLRGVPPKATWLSCAAVACGFGSQVDICPARPDHIAYVVKALGAADTSKLPAFTRRVRWSRGWADRVARPAPRPDVEYWMTSAPPMATAEAAAARGYRVEGVVAGKPSWWAPSWRIRWFPAGSFTRDYSLPRPIGAPS